MEWAGAALFKRWQGAIHSIGDKMNHYIVRIKKNGNHKVVGRANLKNKKFIFGAVNGEDQYLLAEEVIQFLDTKSKIKTSVEDFGDKFEYEPDSIDIEDLPTITEES